MIHFDKDEKNNSGVLTLSGDFGIEQVETLKNAFIAALDNTKKLEMDIEGIEEIDLPVLQLFCSAHRTAIVKKKELILRGACPEALRIIANDAGFASRACSAHDENITCLWNGG